MMGKLVRTNEMFHGANSLSELKGIKGNKAVIVIGKESAKSSGSLKRVQAILDEINIKHEVFSGVEPDPSIETVMKGAEFMLQHNPDWIIGLGGCSSIDAAKTMWAVYEHPELTLEVMVQGGTPPLRNKARFVAIPTTSGTGTETTPLSVITDRAKGVKYPIVCYDFLPDLSLVDGELCTTLPVNITANTGLDALTHSVEAYASNVDDNYADAFAKGSISLVFDNLENAYNNPSDVNTRQKMHDASFLGGYAFANSWLGIAHSLAHQVGGMFGIPHGRANAIVLPNVVRYNSKSTDRYSDLAKLIGKETAEDFASGIEILRDKVNVPASFKECNISEKEWNDKLKAMSQNAFDDVCTSFNPRVPTVEDMEKIFMACYNGTKVTF